MLNLHQLPTTPTELWSLGPPILLSITATLALAYHRSRVLLASLGVALFLYLQQLSPPREFYQLVVVGLLPLNLLLLALFSERGLLTTSGMLRLGVVIGQIAIVVYLINHPQFIQAHWFNPLPPPISDYLSGLPIPQTTAALASINLVLLLIVVSRDESPITQSIATSTLGIAIALSLNDAKSVEAFAMAISLLLTSSIVRDSQNMAYRDELTRMPHRRALNEFFLAIGGRYSVAMLDVDHFKKFNDTHGHDVGDQVLQMVGGKLSQVTGGGRAFRYGGEEFTIVFPRTTKEEAFYHLDEVRKSIANYEMVIRESPREDTDEEKQGKKQRQRGSFRTAATKVSVTISIGVAEKGLDGQDAEEVIKSADKALYVAKDAGRNQVAIA